MGEGMTTPYYPTRNWFETPAPEPKLLAAGKPAPVFDPVLAKVSATTS